MFRMIEAFSGIGSQAKAIRNLGIKYEVVHTIDWDIYAILGYYLIHNENPKPCTNLTDEEIDEKLLAYNLSLSGKKPIEKAQLTGLPIKTKRWIYSAINETRNLMSIKDVCGTDIDSNIDLMTYSFPCQDLSISGYWHGSQKGISQKEESRSGLLWEVDRILREMADLEKKLPRFLLMENVKNILSRTHRKDFEKWKHELRLLGYQNFVFTLNAKNFDIPQKRERTYMISVYCGEDLDLIDKVNEFMSIYDLEMLQNIQNNRHKKTLAEILKVDYQNPIYRTEALLSTPNDTESRRKIYEENDHLIVGEKIQELDVTTLTTKQDRNPNSGVIDFPNNLSKKANWRYLTPRECFLLMGFEEEDYEKIVSEDIKGKNNKNFFSVDKLYKMAGNSIVVNVLETIFKLIIELEELMENIKDNK